jgi:hypothetical protein
LDLISGLDIKILISSIAPGYQITRYHINDIQQAEYQPRYHPRWYLSNIRGDIRGRYPDNLCWADNLDICPTMVVTPKVVIDKVVLGSKFGDGPHNWAFLCIMYDLLHFDFPILGNKVLQDHIKVWLIWKLYNIILEILQFYVTCNTYFENFTIWNKVCCYITLVRITIIHELQDELWLGFYSIFHYNLIDSDENVTKALK